MVAPTKTRNPTATNTGDTEDCWDERRSPKIAIPATIAPNGGTTAESATQCVVLTRDPDRLPPNHARITPISSHMLAPSTVHTQPDTSYRFEVVGL